MIGFAQNQSPHAAKCNHIWRHAARVPDARKAIDSILYERQNDGLQFSKRLFKLIQKASTTQKSASSQPVPPSKAPTTPSPQPKSP